MQLPCAWSCSGSWLIHAFELETVSEIFRRSSSALDRPKKAGDFCRLTLLAREHKRVSLV